MPLTLTEKVLALFGRRALSPLWGEPVGDQFRLSVQDEEAFPLQVACLLSRPARDFEGGDFLLLEQRPRMQSRGEAISLKMGEGLVFTRGNALGQYLGPDVECDDAALFAPGMEAVFHLDVVGENVAIPLRSRDRGEAELGEQHIAWYERAR